MRDYDIILCRNVFIYFSEDTIRRVVENFYRLLRPPGYLFLAAAELLLRITPLFELIEIEGAFGYLKSAAPGAKTD